MFDLKWLVYAVKDAPFGICFCEASSSILASYHIFSMMACCLGVQRLSMDFLESIVFVIVSLSAPDNSSGGATVMVGNG